MIRQKLAAAWRWLEADGDKMVPLPWLVAGAVATPFGFLIGIAGIAVAVEQPDLPLCAYLLGPAFLLMSCACVWIIYENYSNLRLRKRAA